ncbi:hypothetical protein [Aurantiacibacter gangjinensis]|uniref:Uncharacterized protein n=1 Tax=Aurantiacibacter gangjinensis TaxID=502682 RepID=A0A0G9MPT5_9SPHN|nr:hypothetical protein [Aurantiacibacter gangjinensis]APE27176.1 hypothetical protein BMF35_a0347 [Aurantiacibacter gangjinensis]KLE31313.1 hypothetical protein AAW01_06760 [Aurantiacibacter gangjinensis]
MQTVLEFLVQFLLALAGAIGVAIAWVGGMALLCGAGIGGCGFWWTLRRRKRRALEKLKEITPGD